MAKRTNRKASSPAGSDATATTGDKQPTESTPTVARRVLRDMECWWGYYMDKYNVTPEDPALLEELAGLVLGEAIDDATSAGISVPELRGGTARERLAWFRQWLGNDRRYTLDAEHVGVLRAMATAPDRLWFGVDLKFSVSPAQEGKTIGRRVNDLIGLGLAERPNGPRKGARITDEGLRVISRNTG